MHVSGVILLLTFLVPPLWMLNAGYTAPPGDPTADAPFALLLAVPLACVSLHVMVQIPAGLLGTWLCRSRTTPAKYASAVVVASALSPLVLWGLGWTASSHILPAWADATARGSVGLAGYMWVVRTRPGPARHGQSRP
ncbi:hypothetical protein [Streptomyces sp. CRN 30]|uniref:hypothetical protein n=1 Tax=Streptomyces sp. CRN 30 TaxID=3075613 RepID=UPI002A8383ED|nr:hypothetical protein [Streptomyces sp. CRN 30]